MTAPARLGTAGQLLLSSRPLSWINTAFPFAAAHILATGGVDWVTVVGTVFFLIPYNLLMYGINDVFDYASDLNNPRKGGAEGALLDPRLHRLTVWTACLSCLPFVVALLAAGSLASGIVLTIVLFAVVAYSAPGLRFKERPVLDSITSSTHFAGPAVFGLVLASATWTWPLVALIAAFFLWGCASHAFGAVQDVPADRAAGIGSIATVFGAAPTVRLAIALWAAAGVLMLAADWPGPLAAVLVVPYIVATAPFVRVADADAEVANRGWRRFLAINFVAGFLATMLLIGYAAVR